MGNLTKNVWRGIRQKLRRGEYPSRAPVGYLNETKAPVVMVDESKMPLVRRLLKFAEPWKSVAENAYRKVERETRFELATFSLGS